MAIGDIYRMTLKHEETASLTQLINVLHFQDRDGFLSRAVLSADWQANIMTQWRACLHTGIRLQVIETQQIYPFSEVVHTALPSLAGTGGAPGAPPVCAMVITWYTALSGRRNRGRTYLPPGAAGNISGGRWVSTTFTQLGNLAGLMLSRYGLTGTFPSAHLVVWSRLTAGPAPPYNPLAAVVVNGAVARSVVCTMGTRKYGRGI